MPIQQKIQIKSSTENVYNALVSATQFSEWTKAPADIASTEGGSFSCFGGEITGRHIELQEHRLIIQAWRAKMWPAGVYSIVRFALENNGDETELTLDHTGYPEEGADHLDGGWQKMYWAPLKAYLE